MRRLLVLCVLCGVFVGCRQDMHDQPKYRPYRRSDFFGDERSARPQVAGTVARGQLQEDAVLVSGKSGTAFVDTLPMPVDEGLIRRGQERYRIYCIPCHGESGDGRGMIVRRGFNPPPPYYSEELRQQPIGHFFDVMTRGYGTMYSYATRVPPRDRWAIAAYIRVLQLSQHAEVAALSEEDKNKLPAGGSQGQGQGAGQGENQSRRPQQ